MFLLEKIDKKLIFKTLIAVEKLITIQSVQRQAKITCKFVLHSIFALIKKAPWNKFQAETGNHFLSHFLIFLKLLSNIRSNIRYPLPAVIRTNRDDFHRELQRHQNHGEMQRRLSGKQFLPLNWQFLCKLGFSCSAVRKCGILFTISTTILQMVSKTENSLYRQEKWCKITVSFW